jgi:enoyl-CoA hydratase
MITELADSVDEVRKVAWELAERAAALPPLATQLTKRTLNNHLQARINEVLDIGFYLEAATSVSEDLKEAVRAFREHRDGKWTGR